tara:strand:+ start:556 stop:972 length:417 start_codon:yes stop_codon:yes gene_type:complete
MKNKKYDITSLVQLSSVALELLKLSDNRIFAFYGKIGAGKTTLIKYLCGHLKVIDSVSSPTFSIVNEYVNIDGEKFFHFDLYRLNNIEEAQKVGIETYMHSGNYCFIEWPDLIEPLLSKNYNIVKMKVSDAGRELVLL